MKKYEGRVIRLERKRIEDELCRDDIFYESIIAKELNKYKEVEK